MSNPSDEHVRALAKEILARPEYVRWRHDELTASWTKWIFRELAELQRALGALATESPWLFATILVGLTLVALALLTHAGWSIWRSLQPDESDQSRAAPERTSPMATAGTLAESGRFLDATRVIQLAVLEHLVARRVLVLAPAESNAVLTKRLQTGALPPALGHRIVDLVTELERRWFRDRTEDERLYHDWRRLHDDVHTQVA